MYKSCLEKQEAVKQLFADCTDAEAKYSRIIELGRKQPFLDPQFKIAENLVKGCQSTMYMVSNYDGKVMSFAAESDALISAGLAVLLIKVYSGEKPEAILKCPPSYLEELGISHSLSPNRASGLYSLHLRMKQDALKALIKNPE